ncbi:MAG TPA: Ig-like domain repeat protein [Acidobacteriaceae bacterium]
MSPRSGTRNGNSGKFSGVVWRSALWCAVLAPASLGAFAQTPGSIQIPYISTAVGIPTGSTQTVCSTVIATTVGSTGDNCLPTQAILKAPQSVLIDPATNNIFIADQGDKQIRVIYQSGAAELQTIVSAYNKLSVITTSSLLVGDIYNACGPYSNGYTSISAAGGSCGNTTLTPTGMAIDGDGNIIETEGNSRMRMAYVGGTKGAALLQATTSGIGTVSPKQSNVYPMIYASLNAYYGDGGKAIAALTNNGKGVYVDSAENVYIADSKSNAIRMINGTTGIISTIAGSVCTQAVVSAYATITGATVQVPSAISSAGGCTAGSIGDGGPATSAEVNNPYDVLFDASGNLYIADSGNGRVRVIYNGTGTIPGVSSPQLGYIYTVAGGGTLTTGGPATQILLKSATGLGFDAAGNLYIADGTGAKIWEVDAATQVATIIAGGGTSTAAGTACSSTFASGPIRTYANGDGCLATLATLGFPTGRISFDAQGNLYVADSSANVVHKLSKSVPAAPSTALGSTSSTALAFASLSAVTVGGATFAVQGASSSDFLDAGGSTCDTSGQALAAGQICYLNVTFKPTLPGLRLGGVRVSSSTGNTIGTNYVSGTASGAEIALDNATPVTVGSGTAPLGVTSDPSGEVYVADKTSGSVLRYSSPTALTATSLITGLSSPSQVSVDGQGNVLVADTGNNRVAIYNNTSATVSYLTGYAAPKGVLVDGGGNIYVADTGNNRIMQIRQGASTVLTTSVSSPTQLSLDGSGNLYVVDSGNSRVVEVTLSTGAVTPVALGLFNPAAIGIDAANNFYVLDKAGSQVGFISAQGVTTVTLLSGLTAPTGLWVDSLGNVYVTDTSAGVTYLNRQQISTSFYPLNVGQSSAFSSFILTNIGNAALQFTGGAPYSVSGDTGDFQVSASTSNGCSGSALIAGAGCSISAVFSPVALGSFSDKITFPSNAGNASSVSSTLTGSGVNLLNSNLTISSSPSASSSISYGSPITLTFTLTQSGTTAATGKILVQVNGIQQTVLTVANGTATYTFSPQAGTFSIAGQYSGDSNYVSSHASLTLTVIPESSTTTLAYSGAPLSVQGSAIPAYVLTATVKSPAAGVIGVVSFSAGSTTLGIASLNASGVATLTISGATTALAATAINANTYPSFSANYLGGANFFSSTSSSVTVKGDFGMTALATTLSTLQGAETSTSVYVTPYMGLSGTVTFTCSNLPQNSLCRFLTCPSVPAAGSACPVPSGTNLTFSGNSATDPVGLLTLEVFTNVTPNLAKQQTPAKCGRVSEVTEAGLTFLGGLVLLAWRKRRNAAMRKSLLAVVLCVLPILGGLGLSGCGSGTNYYDLPNVTTPPGTTVFTLTATSSNGSVESIPITLVVAASN